MASNRHEEDRRAAEAIRLREEAKTMKPGAAREVRKSRWLDLNSVGPTKAGRIGF
jgi:hypothetical protein